MYTFSWEGAVTEHHPQKPLKYGDLVSLLTLVSEIFQLWVTEDSI